MSQFGASYLFNKSIGFGSDDGSVESSSPYNESEFSVKQYDIDSQLG